MVEVPEPLGRGPRNLVRSAATRRLLVTRVGSLTVRCAERAPYPEAHERRREPHCRNAGRGRREPHRVRHGVRVALRGRLARRLGRRGAAGQAGGVPVHAWCLPLDVHRPPVDDAAVRRLRDRQGVQRALQAARRERHRRAVGRVRPADPDGPRLRLRDRARRGRQGGRRDRLDRRHAPAVRRPASRRGLDVDDDQRPRGAAAADVPDRRRGKRHPWRQDQWHDPERRAEGVHRPRHLHLPAAGVASLHHRHLRLLQERGAALEHHLDLRLPHGRGRGDASAGDRVHAGRRHRVRPRSDQGRPRRRRLRRAAVVLLRLAHHDPGGDREVPCRASHLG